MSWLDDLVNGGTQTVPSPTSTSTQQPDWYQQLLRGIAGVGGEVANRPFQQFPGERQADLTPDQLAAQQGVRNMQGAWQPAVQGGLNALQGALPAVQGALGQAGQFGQQAVGAVGGPAQSWTNNWQQYMSPYTSGVVNEISRLGNQNLFENILPQINDQFISSGGFGSTRNAEMLGRGIRDAQTNISGLQSAALQAGYNAGAGIFANDANRAQQQQQLQGQTALGAGQLATSGASALGNASVGVGNALGGLGQMQQNLGLADINALNNSGVQQQQFAQQGMDLNYNDFMTQQNRDWTQLNNLSSLIRGQQLPTQTTGISTQTYPTTSPLQWLNAFMGMGSANRTAAQPG